jgi:hypothetical protein
MSLDTCQRTHIQGFTFPDEQITHDQSFRDDTILYLAKDEANLEFAKRLLETFYLAMGVKINW